MVSRECYVVSLTMLPPLIVDNGDRQSMISLRYGVRSARQRPGSDDARCEAR